LVSQVKYEVSASVLLAIAVVLLQKAVDLINQGLYLQGVIVAVIAVALMLVTALLVREGVIEAVRRRFGYEPPGGSR